MRCVALVLLSVLALGAGCAKSRPAGVVFGGPLEGGQAGGVTRPPTVAEVAAVYNARVVSLDRIWARAEMRIRAVQDDGSRFDEQVSGHLQVMLPRRVSLTLTSAVGDMYFSIGSDETRYWLFDLLNKPRTLLFGRHDLATERKAAALGVPVLPLDLIELMGISPIPAHGGEAERSEAGLLVVRAPAQGGSKAVWLEPRTFMPRRIVLFDRSGLAVVSCELESDVTVPVRDDVAANPRMATVYRVRTPRRDMDLTIRLNGLENRGRAMRDTPFDFDRLRELRPVEREIDLDSLDFGAEQGK